MKVLEDKIKKARKEHKCDICGEVINKGDEYSSQTYIDDDREFWKFKSHKECVEYIEDIGSIDEVAEDVFWDYLEKDCENYEIHCENKLEAVRKILRIRRKER